MRLAEGSVLENAEGANLIGCLVRAQGMAAAGTAACAGLERWLVSAVVYQRLAHPTESTCAFGLAAVRRQTISVR